MKKLIAVTMVLFVVVVVLPAFAADREAWLGTWEGMYTQGFLDTALVVEKVDGDNAVVIYRWGTSPFWGIRQPGEVKLQGKFTDEKTFVIELPTRSGVGIWATVTYTMEGDVVNAKFVGRAGSFYATLKRK